MRFTYKRDKKMKLRKKQNATKKSETNEMTTLTTWIKQERDKKKKSLIRILHDDLI